MNSAEIITPGATVAFIDKADVANGNPTLGRRAVFGVFPSYGDMDAEIRFDKTQSSGFTEEDAAEFLLPAIKLFAVVYRERVADVVRNVLPGKWCAHQQGNILHSYKKVDNGDESLFEIKLTVVERFPDKNVLKNTLMKVFDRALVQEPIMSQMDSFPFLAENELIDALAKWGKVS